MTAKEFLQQFYVLQREVEFFFEQIVRLQSTAMKATSVVRGVASGAKASTSCIENTLVEIHEKTAQLAEKLTRMVEVRNDIAYKITQIENHNERYLLELRYLCCYPWTVIVGEMRISRESVFRLHRQALDNFREKFTLNDTL